MFTIKFRRLFRRRFSNLSWLIIFFILAIFFIAVFYMDGSLNSTNFRSDFAHCKLAERKIQYLSSLLKRYGISESEFIKDDLPLIYVVTPTYARLVQKAELTKMKNVLLLVPNIHWIVVEDAPSASVMVKEFLASSGIPFTHLYRETPSEWKLQDKDPRWFKPRGVLQRNEALKWLRSRRNLPRNSVVYFADDDNTYSIELFSEMRYTRKVSVWPVGLVGDVEVERPSVNSYGQVDGWIVGWRPDRSFALDMAGFAVSLNLLLENPLVYFSLESKRGFMESDFLQKLVKIIDLEPKADMCSKVFVWHTQTKNPKATRRASLKMNLDPLFK